MFVSRAYHERMLREEHIVAHSALRAQREHYEARYDDLLEKYHALRLQGAAVPEPAPKGLPKKDADPVAEVIADVAGNNSALRKQLGTYARAEKRKGTPTTEITHAILHWGSDEDGPAE